MQRRSRHRAASSRRESVVAASVLAAILGLAPAANAENERTENIVSGESEPVEVRFDRRAADAKPGASSPYSGLEARPIKALSEQEVASYRAGEGMGLAMAAELNGYPGPKHVLELAAELELTPAQVESTRAVFDTMHAAAVSLGDRIVEAEAELDRGFSGKEISEVILRESVGEIARLRGELRYVHLRAHLEMIDVLTAAQRHAYVTHRGYDGASMPTGHHPAMHHGERGGPHDG